jgi:alanine dehydrogenase
MLQLDAAALAERLDRRALIDALDAAFRTGCSAPPREQHHVDAPCEGKRGGTLLIMPAWQAGGALGIKIATVFPDNALQGLPAVYASYVLLDAATGLPRAMLDGGELTRRRTGAASALASRYLSLPSASRLTMVGTGSLAPHLIESHVLVRPIREVRIWGRRTDRARAVAASLAREDVSIEAFENLEEAVRWGDIVSCATLSREPLVQGAWLKPGQHLDLVGAFTPEMREVDDAAIARGELFVDTRSGAFSESGELIGAMARGIIDRSAVRGELSQLASGAFRRSHAYAITIFKSVGTALEDLAAAQLALRQSELPR